MTLVDYNLDVQGGRWCVYVCVCVFPDPQNNENMNEIDKKYQKSDEKLANDGKWKSRNVKWYESSEKWRRMKERKVNRPWRNKKKKT